MSRASQCAESLVEELCITRPEELDVEAIAFDSGVEVAYERLNGCEATLVGYGDRAIATISPSGIRGRERFSIAHEVGHWHLHRGRSFQCRVDGPDSNIASSRELEKEADTFGAHLLMPGSLFNPMVNQFRQPNFQQLSEIADRFETSLMATAIRLANINTLPVIVACYDQRGRRWSLHAKDVPRRWFMKHKLDEDTFTYDLLNMGKECRNLGKQSADAWFENDDAEEYEVLEQCVPSHAGQALVLLYLEPSMVEDEYGRNAKSRRQSEYGSYGFKGR